jgi:hypothetical protein
MLPINAAVLVNKGDGIWYPAKVMGRSDADKTYEISCDDTTLNDDRGRIRAVTTENVRLLREESSSKSHTYALRRGLKVAVRYSTQDSEWHTGTVLRRCAGAMSFDWVSDEDGSILRGHVEKLTRVIVEVKTEAGSWSPGRIIQPCDENTYKVILDSDNASREGVVLPAAKLRLPPIDETVEDVADPTEESSSPYCRNGHQMVSSKFYRFGYENGFWCDVCREKKDRSCSRWFW